MSKASAANAADGSSTRLSVRSKTFYGIGSVAFIIATLLRVAQGSATVAITTTAGLLGAAAAQASLSSFHLTLLVVAIAAANAGAGVPWHR